VTGGNTKTSYTSTVCHIQALTSFTNWDVQGLDNRINRLSYLQDHVIATLDGINIVTSMFSYSSISIILSE